MVTDEMVERAQAAVRTEAVKRDGGYDLHPAPDWAISVVIEAVAPLIAAQARREALEEAWAKADEYDRLNQDTRMRIAAAALKSAIRSLIDQPGDDGWCDDMSKAPAGKVLLLWAVVDTLTGNWKMATGSKSTVEGVWTWDGQRLDRAYHTLPTHWRPLPAPPKET